MKKLLLYLLIPVVGSCQPNNFYTPSLKSASAPKLSFTKNVQLVEDVNAYEAFGFIGRTGADRITYFYRRGTDHLAGGVLMSRNYTISTDTWATADTIYADPDGKDMRDAWGGVMDNDTIVMFSGWSLYEEAGDPYTMEAMIFKSGFDLNFGTPRSIFNGKVPRLQRGTPFGAMQKGTEAGTYYQALWQFNGADSGTVDKPTFPLYRIDVLKTTDYWNTWDTLHAVYEGATAYSECVLIVPPEDNDKMSMIIRTAGIPVTYTSADGGASWTFRSDSRALTLDGTKPKILFSYTNSYGNADIFYGDRDDGLIKVSRNNVLSDYFGIANPPYNDQEIFAFDRVGTLLAADNYKLGYPTALEISPSNYFVVFNKQLTANKANIYYTKSNSIDAVLPSAPPIDTFVVNTTSVVMYIKMPTDAGATYTEAQLNNVRTFEVDLSTDDFSTFVTCRRNYSAGVGSVVGEVHNVTMPSIIFRFYELTSATNYKMRVRAVNNKGKSDWTVYEFTTD